MKPIIYICSPLRWDTKRNIAYVKKLCKQVVKEWWIPIAPHLYFTQFLDDNNPDDRRIWMEMWIHILYMCDDILVWDKYWISEWMQNEISHFYHNVSPNKKYVN